MDPSIGPARQEPPLRAQTPSVPSAGGCAVCHDVRETVSAATPAYRLPYDKHWQTFVNIPPGYAHISREEDRRT